MSHNEFDDLEVDISVHFVETQAEIELQATTVRIANKPGVHTSDQTSLVKSPKG